MAALLEQFFTFFLLLPGKWTKYTQAKRLSSLCILKMFTDRRLAHTYGPDIDNKYTHMTLNILSV